MQLIPVATKIAILQPNIGVGQGLIPSSVARAGGERRRLNASLSRAAGRAHGACVLQLGLNFHLQNGQAGDD